MSRSTRTCESCSHMISRPDLLEKACSPAGLDVTQAVEEYLQALKLGCHICLTIRDHFEQYREYYPNEAFCLLQEGIPLHKNVKCRQSGNGEDPFAEVELPKDYHFDEMVMAARSVNPIGTLSFDVEALDDDPAAKWVGARPLNPDVNRPEVIRSAKQWLSDCVNHHQQCIARSDTGARSTTSPKRLVRVEKDLDGRLKVNLFLCSDQEPQRYAALSYCWGASHTTTLIEANFEAWCAEIPVPSLPQSIQDAVLVVNGLGLSYLWVDALCIIQDCSTDKDEEISVMERIYEQAELTICAGSPAACTEGFLHKRSFGKQPMPTLDYSTLQFACPTGERGMVLLKQSQCYYTTSEPLYSRAWTLQEQMLSSRVLVYSSCLVWWECLEVKGCDGGKPISIRSNEGTIGSLPRNGLIKHVERGARDSNYNHEYLWKAWKEIIEDYSDRDLSVATDKLPALSGLASRFSGLWSCTYYAGLWERRLLEGLQWHLYEPSSWYPDEYIAPSWSWASAIGNTSWADGAIEDTQADHSPAEYTTIIDCRVTLANNNFPFGHVIDGSLIIEGIAQWIEWDGQEQIEAKGLSPNSCPVKSIHIGDPLYPEGIVARTLPDYYGLVQHFVPRERDPDAVTPDSFTIPFYMGVEEAENNEYTIRILLLVISRTSALMLYDPVDNVYKRCGLLLFRSEKELQSYFEGSVVERVVIR